MSARQLPGLTPDNRAFWTGGKDGELRITRCGDCGRYTHPPLPLCFFCKSENVAPVAVSGRGQVHTCTVNHRAWLPGMAVPFVFAVVELEEQEGLFVMTNIVGCAPEAVHIGQRVQVRFEQHEDVWLPMFEPFMPTI